MIIKVAFLALLNISIFAQEYAVVSNKLLAKIPVEQVRAIFLKKMTHLNNIHLVPVNLPVTSKIRQSFENNIVKISQKRLKSYWIKQHYLGKRPPLRMKSELSAVQFVKNVQGAISYVSLKNVNDSVNILYKWSDNK